MTHSQRTAGRRSLYVDHAAADALAQLVDDLHWKTRRPKHELLAAAFTLAVENPDDVLARLSEGTEAA